MLSKSSTFFVGVRKFLPVMFAGIILLIALIQSGVNAYQEKDPTIFFIDLGDTLLALDYKVWNIVDNFQQSGEISILTFLEGISSMYIFFFVIMKYLTKWIMGFTGSATPAINAFILGAVGLMIIEFAAVKFINGIFFIPWKGFLFFIINSPAMFSSLSFVNTGIVDKYSDLINNTADPEVIEYAL